MALEGQGCWSQIQWYFSFFRIFLTGAFYVGLLDGLLGVAGMIITSGYGSFPHSLLSTTMTEVQQLWLSQAHHGHAVLPGFCRPNPYPGGIGKPSGYKHFKLQQTTAFQGFVFFFVGYFEKPSQFLTQLCQIRLWPQPWKGHVTRPTAGPWPVVDAMWWALQRRAAGRL